MTIPPEPHWVLAAERKAASVIDPRRQALAARWRDLTEIQRADALARLARRRARRAEAVANRRRRDAIRAERRAAWQAILAKRVTDPSAVRAMLADAATALGRDLVELVLPMRVGRPTAREQARYDDLARVVATVKDAGATVPALCDVLWRDERRVRELAARGRVLLASR